MGDDGSGSGSVTFSTTAYSKIILHTAKYPWAAVNGLLLGSIDAHAIDVTDAVPLFHTAVLAPMLEVAMMLVDEYCQSEQSPAGLSIVGYYHANARNNDGEIPSLARIVSEKIAVQSSRTACLAMVRAPQSLSLQASVCAQSPHRPGFSPPLTPPSLQVKPAALADEGADGLAAHILVERKGEWKMCAAPLTLSDDSSRSRLTALLVERRQEQLVDFDASLHDAALDWRNPNLCR